MTSGNDTGFGDLPAELCNPETARIAVLPVPYDRTSTWKKGADRGPAAIIEASHQVEWYDTQTQTEIFRQGISTLQAIACDDGPEVLADLVDARVSGLLGRGTFPVVLGGDHSVAIGAIRAASRFHAGASVLQIDAHADTRDEPETACELGRSPAPARPPAAAERGSRAPAP